MDCKITSTKRSERHQLAVTLVELMVAMAIGSVVLTAVASFFLYTAKSFVGIMNYVDLEQYSQSALDKMTRDIRQTDSLAAFATNSLTFRDADGNALIFEYSPTTKELSRRKTGQGREVLLKSCDFFKADIYQRTPMGGVYDYFPTATATNTKMVSISWVCSRKILGTTMNTESVQTAKIVLRKE
jgi:prepilin-type N-terminal cleavage/methylation domain-containing protein